MGKPRPQKIKPYKQSILIICPGEIEQGYVRSLKDDKYRGLSISIEPRLGKADDFDKVLKRLEKEYSVAEPRTCFYLNDMDAIIAQGKLDKYQIARSKELKASKGKLRIIESMPCIEFWFLLHYLYTTKCYPSYDSIKSDVRRKIPGYDKNEAWANKIYATIKDNTDTAIANAKKVMSVKNSGEGACSYTNMHELLEQLDEIMRMRLVLQEIPNFCYQF